MISSEDYIQMYRNVFPSSLVPPIFFKTEEEIKRIGELCRESVFRRTPLTEEEIKPFLYDVSNGVVY